MASPIWMPTHDKFLHYTHITHTHCTHTVLTQWANAFCQKNLERVFCAQSLTMDHPWSCAVRRSLWGFGVCGPKWPLRFYETRSPTLPHILLRVINYAGKPLALRGKVAATIWRQPQFLPKLFHICSPATALWIHCNAYEVSILRL